MEGLYISGRGLHNYVHSIYGNHEYTRYVRHHGSPWVTIGH
jgi:hypothetical protein